MGSQHSRMKENTMTSVKKYPCTSAFCGEYRASPCHQLNKSRAFLRLDSVGEDTPTSHYHYQPAHHGAQSDSIPNLGGQDFSDNPLQNLCAFSSSALISRSRPMPSPAYSGEFSHLRKPANTKLIKSHSLPGVVNTMKMDQRPCRSWSFGSRWDEQAVGGDCPVVTGQDHCTFKPGLLCAISGSCTASNPLTEMGFLQSCQNTPASNPLTTIGFSSSCQKAPPSSAVTNTDLHNSQDSHCGKLGQGQTPSHDGNLFDSVCTSLSKTSAEAADGNFCTSASASQSESSADTLAGLGVSEKFYSDSESCPSGLKSALKCVQDENGHASKNAALHLSDLTSVLFSPRKTSKKGRPSSKKQKKRQRQKQKSISSSCEGSAHEPFVKSDCDSQNVHRSNDDSPVIEPSLNYTCLSPKVSTPVNPSAQRSQVHSLFITPCSSSSEYEESDKEDSDNSDGDDCWSLVDESERGACISPVIGSGFSIALNMDSLFKQKHIPSLQSLLNADSGDDSASECGSPLRYKVSVSVSLSDGDSLDDSVEFGAVILPPVELSSFPWGEDSKSKSQGEASGPVPDDQSAHGDLDLDYNLLEVNAKWNEAYSSPDACNCCNLHSGVASSPVYRVGFLEGPSLVTVHSVENEDRAGTWHHFALDRERFERRIKETGLVLSPILEANHRATVAKRNAALLETQDAK